MKTKIILIHGKARSGKDTVADMIKQNCSIRGLTCSISPNARPVKEIATRIFGWDGEKDERGRGLLIDITNAGYNYDPNFWEKENVTHYVDDSNNLILVPDFRYETTYNYYKTFCEVFGHELITLHVVRPDHDNELGKLKEDISETHLATFDFDFVINNTGTIEDLEKLVDMYFNGIVYDGDDEIIRG